MKMDACGRFDSTSVKAASCYERQIKRTYRISVCGGNAKKDSKYDENLSTSYDSHINSQPTTTQPHPSPPRGTSNNPQETYIIEEEQGGGSIVYLLQHEPSSMHQASSY